MLLSQLRDMPFVAHQAIVIPCHRFNKKIQKQNTNAPQHQFLGDLGNENSTKARYISPATNALIKIVHRKRNPAIIAQTQAPTRPNDNSSRIGLADYTLGSSFAHARGASGPGIGLCS